MLKVDDRVCGLAALECRRGWGLLSCHKWARNYVKQAVLECRKGWLLHS